MTQNVGCAMGVQSMIRRWIRLGYDNGSQKPYVFVLQNRVPKYEFLPYSSFKQTELLIDAADSAPTPQQVRRLNEPFLRTIITRMCGTPITARVGAYAPHRGDCAASAGLAGPLGSSFFRLRIRTRLGRCTRRGPEGKEGMLSAWPSWTSLLIMRQILI